jgi:hypothetical protein
VVQTFYEQEDSYRNIQNDPKTINNTISQYNYTPFWTKQCPISNKIFQIQQDENQEGNKESEMESE